MFIVTVTRAMWQGDRFATCFGPFADWNEARQFLAPFLSADTDSRKWLESVEAGGLEEFSFYLEGGSAEFQIVRLHQPDSDVEQVLDMEYEHWDPDDEESSED